MISGTYLALGLISTLIIMIALYVSPIGVWSFLWFLFPLAFFLGAYGVSRKQGDKLYLFTFVPLLMALIFAGIYALKHIGLI